MATEDKTAPKTWGLVMICVGIFLAIGAFASAIYGSVNNGEEALGVFSISMMVLMVAGIVIAFLGFQRVMSSKLPPMVPPRHYNEYQIVCDRCETELQPGVPECPKCGNKIEWNPPDKP